jgi:DNA polymerase/3'-5' exonuclease PolX
MMRRKAIEMGYSLSEYGLTNVKSSQLIELRSEEELFQILGEKYVPPTEREMGK